jgi:hypothetical protein
MGQKTASGSPAAPLGARGFPSLPCDRFGFLVSIVIWIAAIDSPSSDFWMKGVPIA